MHISDLFTFIYIYIVSLYVFSQALAYAFCLTHSARGGCPSIYDIRTFKGDTAVYLATELEPELQQQHRDVAEAAAAEAKPLAAAAADDDDAHLLPSCWPPSKLDKLLAAFEASLRKSLCELPSVELLL